MVTQVEMLALLSESPSVLIRQANVALRQALDNGFEVRMNNWCFCYAGYWASQHQPELTPLPDYVGLGRSVEQAFLDMVQCNGLNFMLLGLDDEVPRISKFVESHADFFASTEHLAQWFERRGL